VKRIEFLIYSPYPRYSGGRENWLHNLAPALRRSGYEVQVTSYQSDRPPFYHGFAEEIVPLPSLRRADRGFLLLNRLTLGLAKYLDIFLAYRIVASRHLRRTRPEVLVCMNSLPEGLAAARAGIPFAVAVRGDVPSELGGPGGVLRPALARLERSVLRGAKAVLANGEDTRERLAAAGIASVVVPNGVDLERFSAPGAGDATTARIEAAAAGRPVIAMVGTVRAVKGVGLAVDVAAKLREKQAPFLLAMVGKGDLEGAERLARRAGAADSVLVAGESSDIPAVLGRSALFLAVSGGGGMSMAVLEAMAAGLPIVAIDTPIYRQLVVDGESGLLASDAGGLAAACLRLLAEPPLAARLGAAARESVRQYGWDAVAERLVAALDAAGLRPPGTPSASLSGE
jgi:colanic acid/amylovoran biosynthesis glycosyltransferase